MGKAGKGGRRGVVWAVAIAVGAVFVVGVATGIQPDAAGRAGHMRGAPTPGGGVLRDAGPGAPVDSARHGGASSPGIATMEPSGEPSTVYLRPGDGYREIMARLGPESEHDPVALFLTGEATVACVSESTPGAALRARTTTARALLAWKSAFCRGEFAGAERRDDILRRRMAGIASRHPEWAGRDSSGGAPFFDAVLSGGTLDEMQTAISLLSVGESWDLGHELVDGTPLAANLSKYQTIALESLMCDVTGGCGPNGLRTAMLCIQSGDPSCHPGRSVYDTWNDEFSPNEKAIIVAMRERVAAERARRAGGAG